MPSNNIDSCAGVSATVPLVTCGQMNLPRSSLFANKHNPSPSHHNILIKSPRRPRNTNTCPENGFSSSAVCTIPLNPVNPRRRSVTPAAIQIFVPPGARSSEQILQHGAQCFCFHSPRNAKLSLGNLDLHRPRTAARRHSTNLPGFIRRNF